MRIFFGATLPAGTKTQIEKIQEEVRVSIHGVRIESRDKLHITLQFIGDFKPEKIETLFSAVSEEIEKSSFRSSANEINGMSYFPNDKIRRGIWIDCRDDGTLAGIADSIKSVTGQFGVVPETRAFKSHITIAQLRVNGGGRSLSDYVNLQKLWSNGKLTVERFFPVGVALFESTLKSSGSEYKILSEIPLVGISS